MKALADKIDADLTTACGKLAKDLGDSNSYKNGQDACKAAAKIIGDTKAKLGANAKFALDFSEPHCGLDINAYGDCGASCDATVKPGSAASSATAASSGHLLGPVLRRLRGERRRGLLGPVRRLVRRRHSG